MAGRGRQIEPYGQIGRGALFDAGGQFAELDQRA